VIKTKPLFPQPKQDGEKTPNNTKTNESEKLSGNRKED
jgi:hypothetical protein